MFNTFEIQEDLDYLILSDVRYDDILGIHFFSSREIAMN